MTARDQIPDDRFAPDDRQVAQLRIPPNSIESESSVLGGLLQNNAAWDVVGDLLAPEDFYRHEHRLVYTAICTLINASRPADVVTVFEQLQRDGHADAVGGLAYLNALAQYVPTASNIRRYAEIVRERAVLRKLVSTSEEIASAAFNLKDRSVDNLLDEAMQKVLSISPDVRSDDWEDMDTGMVRLLDRIQSEADGTSKPDIIPTGLAALDDRLDGGLRPGEVVVIGARPSMGKSALGLTIGVSTAQAGEPTAYWSGEMPRAQLHTRAMSMASHIHLSRLKRAERLRDFDWPEITKGVDRLRNIPFYVNDQAGLTITKLRGKVRALKRQRGLRVLVIDYLGLMDATDPKMPRVYQVEEITKGIKQLAKELGLAVILLVQLSREVEKRVDQMPILSDLRDSGAIEQDADIVIFVHRPHKAKPDLGDEWKYYAKLSVAKLRDGEPGYVDLMYVGENTHFMDWPNGQELPSSQVRVSRGKEL